MNNKPNEKDWMDYLYGEMEGSEREAMERYLLEHPEARAELDSLQLVRGMLGRAEDQEVIAPPIFVGDSNRAAWWNFPYFKTIVGIAASLVIVMLAAKFAGLRVGVSENELRLSFGETKTVVPAPTEKQEPMSTPVASLSEEQVQSMIASALESNNSAVSASIRQSQEKLNASIQQNLAANSHKIDQLMQQAALASQEQVRQYVAALQTENMTQVKDYFALSATEQKKYMEDLLVDFAQYLQQQRNNDLQLVQMKMKDLEQNTNIFKQETEQILTGIISSVRSNTPPMETKN